MNALSNRLSFSRIYSTSLAIFAMLFGAGNLVLPPKVGILSGSKNLFGLVGFLTTGVLVPLLGLIAIIAFNGNYREFFGRLGKIPGFLITLFCMLAIGPVIVMPRIVTLSYAMLKPFLPAESPLWLFAVLFLGLAFLATYKPSRLLDIIGKFLSPLKVACVLIIILVGIFTGTSAETVITPSISLFIEGIKSGYLTLDLLGAIFFGSIIVTLLRKYETEDSKSTLSLASLSGLLACTLLALVYTGMSYLGVFHGKGLEHLDESQIFSALSFRILGNHGAALIGITVFLACFITAVALTAVVSEYVRNELFSKKISYPAAILLVLGACLVPSLYGFGAILKFSVPLLLIMYPIVIVITVCNLLYKFTGFRYIKLPVAITAILVVGFHWYSLRQAQEVIEKPQAEVELAL